MSKKMTVNELKELPTDILPSFSRRHTLLEALRVASVWHHSNNTAHATPVLPYARLAFTHSLTFLNTVGFVAAHKIVHTHTHTHQL